MCKAVCQSRSSGRIQVLAPLPRSRNTPRPDKLLWALTSIRTNPQAYSHSLLISSLSTMTRFVTMLDQIILFGDSITQQSFSQERGFAFGAELSNQYVRKLDVINRGFSGYNTAQALKVGLDNRYMKEPWIGSSPT